MNKYTPDEVDLREPITLMMCGSASCGKTSLLHRFMKKKLRSRASLAPTIEDIHEFTYKLQDTYNLNLRIIDTAGDDLYKTSTKSQLVSQADGFIVVADLTDAQFDSSAKPPVPTTLTEMKDWLNTMGDHEKQSRVSYTPFSYPTIPLVICGNKADSVKRFVSDGQIVDLINEHVKYNISSRCANSKKLKKIYWETSATQKLNVKEIFESVIEQVIAERVNRRLKIDVCMSPVHGSPASGVLTPNRRRNKQFSPGAVKSPNQVAKSPRVLFPASPQSPIQKSKKMRTFSLRNSRKKTFFEKFFFACVSEPSQR